jgi:hypothetical protein
VTPDRRNERAEDMKASSVDTILDRQYKTFIKQISAAFSCIDKKRAAKLWQSIWGKWLVCSATDMTKLVGLEMDIRDDGGVVVYAVFDDPVMCDRFVEKPLEDLVAGCYSYLKDCEAKEGEIEAAIRRAFESGMARAKQNCFDGFGD